MWVSETHTQALMPAQEAFYLQSHLLGQKLAVFLHASSEQSENNVEEANLFTTASRRTKILRVRLTKEVPELLHDRLPFTGLSRTLHCCKEFRGHVTDTWPKTAFFNFWYYDFLKINQASAMFFTCVSIPPFSLQGQGCIWSTKPKIVAIWLCWMLLTSWFK